MTKHDYYYDISEDMKRFPACWAFLIIGGRSTGKTYGTLWHCYDNGIKFVFIKRTIEDVNLLCNRGKLGQYELDLSPFKPINRDKGCNVQSRLISDKGIGAFYDVDGEGNIEGQAVGYILALSAVQKFKGFDLSECGMIIFDEFIPQPWERVNRKEGEQLLDLYKTVARDREHRGQDALKLVCLANAVNISNPVMSIFEKVDAVADMQATGGEYLEENGVLVHMLKTSDAFMDTEKETSLFKSMGRTAWGRMAFDNEFAYDDLTNIGKVNLKGYKCIVHLIYKQSDWYIYRKEGMYYISTARNEKYAAEYNLNLENDQKLFNIKHRIRIYDACIMHKVVFQSYTMYDVIMNYTKYFKL